MYVDFYLVYDSKSSARSSDRQTLFTCSYATNLELDLSSMNPSLSMGLLGVPPQVVDLVAEVTNTRIMARLLLFADITPLNAAIPAELGKVW